MNITMKKKPRAPRVGDVFLEGTSPIQVTELWKTDDGEPWAMVDEGRSCRLERGRPVSELQAMTLVSTGARTLAEREAAGELPDISEDDRTPLERMTAERDALRAERDNMRGAYHRLQARMGELFQEAKQVVCDWRETANAETRAGEHERLMRDFALAFTASQGRVIRELREKNTQLSGLYLDLASHEIDLAEALNALRGMVSQHCESIMPQPGEPLRWGVFAHGSQCAALAVLAKHGIVKNWDGRLADWADDAQEVAE